LGTSARCSKIEFVESQMTREEVITVLKHRINKRTSVTFSDGIMQSIVIESVDEEGFCHSGPDGTESHGYWTRFEDVSKVES